MRKYAQGGGGDIYPETLTPINRPMPKVTAAASSPNTTMRSPDFHTGFPVKRVMAVPSPNKPRALSPMLMYTAGMPPEKMNGATEKRAIEEMKHAETHIGRILFLEGKPVVSNLNQIHIGQEVQTILDNDHKSEEVAIGDYNKAIKLRVAEGDNGTREMLEGILKDEEAHIDWIEAQLDQIEQMGIQNYLVEQLG